MFSLRVTVSIVLCISMAVVASSAIAGPEQEKAKAKAKAVKAAKAWLARVDAGQYGKSWDGAAAFFKKAVTREKWISSLQAARKPLGKLLSRKVKIAKPMKDLPNAPKGDYVVIQFKTSFAAKAEAVETVTPMKDKDGVWRVSGYFIK